MGKRKAGANPARRIANNECEYFPRRHEEYEEHIGKTKCRERFYFFVPFVLFVDEKSPYA
jgi:hypothetical protein